MFFSLILKEKKFLVAIIAILIVLVGMLYMYTVTPPQDANEDVFIVIPKGLTLVEISQQLYNENIIRSPKVFSRIVSLFGGERGVQAGTYYIRKPQNSFVVARRIVEGDQGFNPVKITIPEGYTRFDIAHALSEEFNYFDPQLFLRLTETKEGYLFPDTYFFFPNVTAEEVIERMEQNFREKTLELSEAIDISGRSLSDIIIMASIVEAEAGIFEDRRLIAGVLWNRLDLDMPLQVDVTFKYINGKTTFDLTREDLEDESPYNTYVHKGLPPTPISNPGLSSIVATIDHEETDYIYFLADNEGNTHFSKTFDEHVRKKELYLR